MKQYKVAWGPDQHTVVGSHVVAAKTEIHAKAQVRKILNDTYGDPKFHKIKILYAIEVERKPNEP